jgi:hypothetical protein
MVSESDVVARPFAELDAKKEQNKTMVPILWTYFLVFGGLFRGNIVKRP